MDDKRLEGPGEGQGIPRDLPDEQAGDGPDHWDPEVSETPEEAPEGTGSEAPAPGEPAD
ncbi:hypothetical protein [Streptomyces sp. NPDC050856]|uniref:hypothetical protein n=1 Tax=Streptomyces sp. NPDC050856 TaxID=3154939 RepID=UPI0033FEAB0D